MNAVYISAHSRARIVVALLLAGAVVSLVSIPVGGLEVLLPEVSPDQEVSDNPGGMIALVLQGVLGLLTLGIFVATVIVFLMWLYRSCNNLSAFGLHRRQIEYSPGWAVGSFFVPFVNLVVPYRAVKEVWQKSETPASISFSSAVSPPGFFPAWWGFWLVSNFASNAYFRMTMAGAPRDATAIVGVISDALSIGAAGFAVMVVKEIDRRQEEASRHLPSPSQFGPLPPPPPVFHPEAGKRVGESAESATSPAGAEPPKEVSE